MMKFFFLVVSVSVSQNGDYPPIEEVYVLSSINDVPVGSWKNESFTKTCTDGYLWIVKKLDEGSSLNWMLQSLESATANVTFR